MKLGKTNTVFNLFLLDHIKDIQENVNYYATISEDSKEDYDRLKLQELKLKSQIVKVGLRNCTLAKYLMLKASYQTTVCGTSEDMKNFNSFKAKRGRKTNEYTLPIRYIMKFLKCSRRMAIVYSQALVAETMIEEAFKIGYGIAVMRLAEKKEPNSTDSEINFQKPQKEVSE